MADRHREAQLNLPCVSILTNFQAPYRDSLFEQLGRRLNLQVYFLYASDDVRHFRWRETSRYSSIVLGARRLGKLLQGRYDTELGVLSLPKLWRLTNARVLVVLGWEQPAYLSAILLARMRSRPYVIYTESTLATRTHGTGMVSFLRASVLRGASFVWVGSEEARLAAVADGVDIDNLFAAANVVDENFVRGIAHEREQRHEGSPSLRAHNFIYVGQLIERKNLHALIEALSSVPGPWLLTVIGDGSEAFRLRQSTILKNLDDRITFVGFLEGPALIEAFAHGDTLILPSLNEVYGMTAHEAYAAGLNVVVSSQAGIAGDLRDRENAWIVDPTVPALIRALTSIVKRDPIPTAGVREEFLSADSVAAQVSAKLLHLALAA